jgi:RimJ/RimL family protein N-acetyltransferase
MPAKRKRPAAKLELRGKTILLRPVQASDAEPLYRLIRDKELLRRTTLPQPYRRKDMTEFLKKADKARKAGSQYILAIRLYNRADAIGCIGIHGVTKVQASLGYWLGRRYWSQGIMTQAVKLVLQFCFDRLKLHRVGVMHAEGNEASRRVVEKCWFRREGLAREAVKLQSKWDNVVCYGLLEQEYRRIRDPS